MSERFATTPFGGGRMRASIFQVQERTGQQRAAMKEGANESGRVDKWKLLRALTEARSAFCLSDRTIAVLEALSSFWQSAELDGSSEMIVFPSNAELSLRLRGMADATIRRHLSALVEAGLIIRRDSPNGKRYCRRDGTGQIESAFGFDLSPFALSAGDIFAAADAARAHERRMHKLRTELSIHQRDASKILEAAVHEGRAGDWDDFMVRLAGLSVRTARRFSQQALEGRLDAMVRLRAEIENTYLASLTKQEMSGNDIENERHIQNSKTDFNFEISSEKELKPTGELQNDQTGTYSAPAPIPVDRFRNACPQLSSYAHSGLERWSDVITTAQLVRSMLGISKDAWLKANTSMGELNAAITIAAILERADEIRSPGGYLRALTERAEKGHFSVLPMILALEGRNAGR